MVLLQLLSKTLLVMPAGCVLGASCQDPGSGFCTQDPKGWIQNRAYLGSWIQDLRFDPHGAIFVQIRAHGAGDIGLASIANAAHLVKVMVAAVTEVKRMADIGRTHSIPRWATCLPPAEFQNVKDLRKRANLAVAEVAAIGAFIGSMNLSIVLLLRCYRKMILPKV
jgi:hypothetical protein